MREAIDSILAQTFTDFEFLLLNDSPENTEIDAIVASYADPRIVYTKNAKNLGISGSRNQLIEMARGEYLAIFDHDDISLPERLQKEVDFLDANPEIGVVSGWLQKFGGSRRLLRDPEFDGEIKIKLISTCCVAHTAAMIRKSVLTANNLRYEVAYSPAEDYRLWVRLIEFTGFYNLPETLVNYRWHANNTVMRQNRRSIAAATKISREAAYKYPYLAVPRIKIKLFGFIPLIKIKNSCVYLFGVIPLFSWK